MNRRWLLHLACVFLLLIAQHGAFTHSVWHLGDHLPIQAQGELESAPAQDDHAPQSKLCDLHFAMGSLLAGDCAGQGVADAAPLSPILATTPAVWRVAQPSLTPPTRAPPVLL